MTENSGNSFSFHSWIQTAAAFVTCFSVFIGQVTYIREGGEREKQFILQAWDVVNNASGLEHSGGRIKALEDLNSKKQSLAGLTAIRANLTGVQLSHADVRDAVLCVVRLEKANLKKANLEKANLEKANLREANLEGAILKKAILKKTNMQGVIWKNADIEGANFYGAFKIDIKEIKKAKNWKKAYYSNKYLKQLELPDTQHVYNDNNPEMKGKNKQSDFEAWHNNQCKQK